VVLYYREDRQTSTHIICGKCH